MRSVRIMTDPEHSCSWAGCYSRGGQVQHGGEITGNPTGLRGWTVEKHEPEVRTLLAALRPGEESDSLRKMLSQSDWEVRFVRTVHEALTVLRERPAGVLLSESHFSDGRSWKDLLDELQWLESPPMLIVTDRLADYRLWAEVLNVGGYDVLLSPLQPAEVLHVVNAAWQAWTQRRAYLHAKPLGFAVGAGPSASREPAGRS